VDGDLAEAGLGQHGPGPLLAPGRAQAGAPSASDTVMQCRVLVAYSIGAIGLPMLSSRLLEALGSTMTKVPPGASAAWIHSRTAAGAPWSWMASNTNTTSKGSSTVSRATSRTSKRALASPAAASSTIACPVPQPTSATRAPAVTPAAVQSSLSSAAAISAIIR
jgi:hypothetical protein